MLTLAFLDQLEARLLDMAMFAGKKTVVTVRERGQDRFEYRIAGKPGDAGILYFDTVDNQVPTDFPPGGQVIFSCSHKMIPIHLRPQEQEQPGVEGRSPPACGRDPVERQHHERRR